MTITATGMFSAKHHAPKYWRYRATWPCGSIWDYDKRDLEVPVFADGKQTGVSICADTLREMREQLEMEGARVEPMGAWK